MTKSRCIENRSGWRVEESGATGQAKDLICGMLVDKANALRSERGGRSYYFCSAGCQRTFESPEQELKSMRTRVAIAMTGVLALAIMRAGAFLTLATGATIDAMNRLTPALQAPRTERMDAKRVDSSAVPCV